MRQAICFLAILLCGSSLIAGEKQSMNPQLLSAFFDLWKDSGYGQNPDRIERAEWILGSGSGSLEFRRWPTSGERNKEFWHGPIPQKTIAQAHTHTVMADPKPSRKDVDLSRRIGVALYTISGRGIWMVTPDGHIRQTADSRWYGEFEE